MRKLATLFGLILAACVLASSCGGGQPAGAPPSPVTTPPTSEPGALATADAAKLEPGVWVEILTDADCLDVFHGSPMPGENVVGCLPPGFVGMLAGESLQWDMSEPPWWPLAGQGWVREADIRFHHVGDLPYPPPNPDLSLAGEIAFRGADDAFWLMAADATGTRRISEKGPECVKDCFATSSQWSPDGDMLAIGAKPQSWLKVVDSSGQTIFSVSDCSDPVWSPTSRLLAASCLKAFARRDLTILDLEGNVVHDILAASITNWAADGQRLSFLRTTRLEDSNTFVVPAIFDLESGEFTELDAEMPSSELLVRGSPLWSPSGPWLAYDHRLTNVDTGEVLQLPGRIDSWAPGGRFLLLDDTQIYDSEKRETIGELELSAPLPAPQLARPPESPEQLARRLFAWSPDGELAIQLIRPVDVEGSPSVLRIIELETGHVRTVEMPVPPSEPELSPGGQFLAFSTDAEHTGGEASGYGQCASTAPASRC